MSEPRDSYSRCLSFGRLASLHYEVFVGLHPDIRPLFVGVDIEAHKEMLRHMHTVLIMFGSGDEFAKQALERTARRHGPSGMNISNDLYEFWVKSLIEAVRECDPAFTPEVEKAWLEVARKGVDLFTCPQSHD